MTKINLKLSVHLFLEGKTLFDIVRYMIVL